PERKRRRPTTTSPGFSVTVGFSAARLRQGFFSPPASSAAGSSAAASPEFSPVAAVAPCGSSFGTASRGSPACSSGASRTFATASASSGSTSVSITWARPMGGRLAVPLKIQSDIRSARSILWLCSPSTQEMASTTFDLPQPLGPTMQVIPLPLNVMGVFSKNDLKPNNSTLRSFSTQTLAEFVPPPPRQKNLQFKLSQEDFRDKNAWRVNG